MAAPIEDALGKVLHSFSIPCLKDEQRKILDCLLERRDCMAILPTGFGKSLPHQLLVPLLRETKSTDPMDIGRVIVCCPIVSLMDDQVTKLAKIPNVTAAYRGCSEAVDRQIKAGEIDVIYASPETLVGSQEWRSALQENLSVAVIVVDEFHTIATWGDDSGKKKAFRKWFGHIGELRAMFPEASILALSATCTNKIKKRAVKELSLTDYCQISMSPNRPNIKLIVDKVPREVEAGMFWLIEALQDINNFPRTIIYCRTIKSVSGLYRFIIDEVPSCDKFVEMYHSATPESTKASIMNKLCDSNSCLKVVIATSALGMGVDIVDFHSVVIYGPPQNLVDTVQEIGRVGRDGNPSVALMLYHSAQLTTCDKEVKHVFKDSEDCHRMSIMSSFLTNLELDELMRETGVHMCCDICEKKCTCGNCYSEKSVLEKLYFFCPHQVESDTSNESDASTGASDNLFSDTDEGLLVACE